ncbi:YiiX/YebB-like N1pC/P60 family cysteine hydrolase [Chryseobacterium potabilaquae]|uniref:YiiX/YebB-like N1pC/P60 family cysteine hydrolase n=1 Tax=Chryseobacterium potabilaquae TaxID=2675057 RepID=UPI001E50EA02|nr:YiiX/YebB-like N1pC/P60 family cysteine hydrolase [Chryseobacterium potabilaquae]
MKIGSIVMKQILRNNFLSKIGILFILLQIVVQCTGLKNNYLKNGDLLFVTAKESGLSGAINKVTQRQRNISFDHIGILEIVDNDFFVLHASPIGGSQRQSLKEFVKNQKGDNQKIIVYRLKKGYEKIIPEAIKNAESMLGKPYNDIYILNEDSYYCSDFVERAFRDAHIFKLEPMTFKDPMTGQINSFWEGFYKKKNIPIPEGKLGCNPNGLAGSDKLEMIMKYR